MYLEVINFAGLVPKLEMPDLRVREPRAKLVEGRKMRVPHQRTDNQARDCEIFAGLKEDGYDPGEQRAGRLPVAGRHDLVDHTLYRNDRADAGVRADPFAPVPEPHVIVTDESAYAHSGQVNDKVRQLFELESCWIASLWGDAITCGVIEYAVDDGDRARE